MTCVVCGRVNFVHGVAGVGIWCVGCALVGGVGCGVVMDWCVFFFL